MTLQVQCKRCGQAFTPARGDIVRGDWRVCPGCRGKASGEEPAGQRPTAPDATVDAPEATTGAPAGREAA